MAISYFRQGAVKRSNGDCAVRKSAYYARESLYFEGSCALAPKTFDYSDRKLDLFYHNVLLPEGADEKFKDIEYLWNQAAKAEARINAQEAHDFVFALPKEEIFSREDLIRISEKLVNKHFVSKGLIAQIAIHHKRGNPHLHILVAQRYLKENGKEFGEKAVDIKNELYKSRLNFLAKQFLDDEFKAMGLDLRCDPPGIISQIHLGAKGTHGRAFDLQFENIERIKLNAELAKDPKEILQAIIKYQSVFSPEDVDRFIDKHTPETHREQVRKAFWKQSEIVQMLDKKTREKLDRFSTLEVIREENKLMKVIGYLNNQKSRPVDATAPDNLSEEQKQAFAVLLQGKGIMCLRGLAGTGKSYVLKAVHDAYVGSGTNVYTLGADSPAANALKDKGISNAMNMHRLMHSVKHNRMQVQKGSLFILDEAGKIGNEDLLEFSKFVAKHKGMAIWSGDPAQLAAIARGGGFDHISSKVSCAELSTIQRQKDREEAKIATQIAKSNTNYAIDKLLERKAIHFSDTRAIAMSELAKKWATDHANGKTNYEKSIIITATNKEAHTLNEMIRQTRLRWGDIKTKDEVLLRTAYGQLFFAKGDLIVFRQNDSNIGVDNGTRGKIVRACEDLVEVEIGVENGKKRIIPFDPKEYRKFHHGYAVNAHLSQGGTWARTYFLHCAHLSRQMFYVVASRHTDWFGWFVAKTDAPSIAAFKAQARRDGEKDFTHDYKNLPTLKEIAEEKALQREIAELKESDKFFHKVKGHFRSAVGFVKGKIEERWELKGNPEWYNWKERVTVHPKDESHKVNQEKTIDEMVKAKEFVFSIPGDILNEVDPDRLYKTFFELNEKASEAHAYASEQAEKEGMPIQKTEGFKALGKYASKRNAVAKAYLEKSAWDEVSIRNTYGEDLERAILQSTQNFDKSFDKSKIQSTLKKEPLFALWESHFLESREHLKKIRLESAALSQSEEKHPQSAAARQAAFEASWIGAALFSKLEGFKKRSYEIATSSEKEEFSPVQEKANRFFKTISPSSTAKLPVSSLTEERQETVKLKQTAAAFFTNQGKFILSEKSRAFFSEEAVASIEGGAKSFQESLKPLAVFQEGAQIKNERLSLCASRLEEEHKAISLIRETVKKEIAIESVLPKDCKSYEKFYPHWRMSSALTAHLFELAKKEELNPQEATTEKLQAKKYQAERFEEQFKVITRPYKGKIFTQLNETVEHYVEAQTKAYPLLRQVEIEAALQKKPNYEIEGYFQAEEAKSLVTAIAMHLSSQLKEFGKDTEELLDERVAKQIESFEKRVLETGPIVIEKADGVIAVLARKYAEVEKQASLSLIECYKEMGKEGNPLNECKQAASQRSYRHQMNEIAFAMVHAEKKLETSSILPEKKERIARMAERFEKSLEPRPFLLEEPAQEISTAAKPIIAKYEASLAKINDLKKICALELGQEIEEGKQTASKQSLMAQYGVRDNLASQIFETFEQTNTKLGSVFTEEYANRISRENAKFQVRFETPPLFVSEVDDKKLMEFEELHKKAQLLQKLIAQDVVKEDFEQKDSEFFEDRNEVCSKRNEKSWVIREIGGEPLEKLSSDGKEILQRCADRFEESLKPYAIFEENAKIDDGDLQKLLSSWEGQIAEVLKKRKVLILDEARGNLSEEGKIEICKALGKAARNRNTTAYNITEKVSNENIDLKAQGVTEKGVSEAAAQTERYLKGLEEGKGDFVGEFLSKDKYLPENLKQAAETFVKAYSGAIEAKDNLYEAAKGKKKIFDLPEWEAKKKAVDKRDAFANLTKTLAEKENVPLTDIFTTAGESAHKGVLFKFDGKFSYKSPLAKGDHPEKTHPLVKEYCTVGKEIAQARKQFVVDKEALEKFPFESSNRMRSLCLQQDMIAKNLVDSFGSSKVRNIFAEKSANKVLTQVERIEAKIALAEEERYRPPIERFLSFSQAEPKWVGLIPHPSIPAPGKRRIEDCMETVRHAYRDANGKLLYYVLRLEDGKGNKATPPLSFGYKEGEEDRPYWRMKGVEFGEKRTLYNLHLLKENPKATVVIVEGEKAADKAAENLKKIKRDNYLAVSWCGGSKAVSKTDWSPLAGRNVLIWPDNDKPGFSAGKQIEKELFSIRCAKQEIRTVDPNWLQETFPKGWDLADPWPKDILGEDGYMKAKGFHIGALVDRFEYLTKSREKSFAHRLMMTDIALRFLDRKREEFEKQIRGKSNAKQERIFMDAAEKLHEIFEKEETTTKRLGEDPNINASGELQKDLARQCTLFEAKHGREPRLSELLLMKQALGEAAKAAVFDRPSENKEALACIKQRKLERFCAASLERGKLTSIQAEGMQKQIEIEARTIMKMQTREQEVQKQLEIQRQIDRGRGFGY